MLEPLPQDFAFHTRHKTPGCSDSAECPNTVLQPAATGNELRDPELALPQLALPQLALPQLALPPHTLAESRVGCWRKQPLPRPGCS
jgi:hypothetical protein